MRAPASWRSEMENGRSEKILEVLRALREKGKTPSGPPEELDQRFDPSLQPQADKRDDYMDWVPNFVEPASDPS